MKLRIPAILALAAAGGAAQTFQIGDVLTSQHNFRAGGAPVTSSETRACVFCHVPHNGSTPAGHLWNQRPSGRTYTPYSSPSMNAAPGSPGAGSSQLCLSCHDGTVALGQSVASGKLAVAGAMAARDITGVDFGRHHPTGIRPVDDGQLYAGLAQTPARSADPAVKLPGNIIECITCHDPHVEKRDASRGRFLVRSNQGSALCLACHDPTRAAPSQLAGWTGSAHQASTHARTEFYGTVGADACQSCHLPHNTGTAVPLLRASEENACVACHGGTGTSPALVSVMASFAQAYAHPTTALSGLHSPTENAFPLNANRHAECTDCHNSHASRPPSASTAPALPPAMAGTSGVDGLSGATARRPASNEYEVCFKCHANSAGKPQAGAGYAQYGRTPRRATDRTAPDPFNTRLEFSSLVSRHPVTNPRQHTSAQVPSLRPSILLMNGAAGRSLAAGSIYCGDCHNSGQARNAGGPGASGAHGSQWPHILERRYDTEAPTAAAGGSTSGVSYQPGVAGTAALCYKCHDIDGSIMLDRSFSRHSLHINLGAACATCHDSHGINGGNATNNPSLVNFDTAIVGPPTTGTLRLERAGNFTGKCYLRCHGQNHNGLSY